MEGNLDFANRLADLDDLSCAGHGMGFNLAPRSPVVSGIVMADITEHHAALDPVEDQPNVTAGTGRPEVLVFDVVETVTLQAWVSWINLKFKASKFCGFLIFRTEPLQARLKCVSEKEAQDGESG